MAKKNTESTDGNNGTVIRIGLNDSQQELNFEIAENSKMVSEKVKAAMTKGELLILVDLKEREVIIPGSKINFVEIGEVIARKVGFASN
jgi:hypothetical protein